MKRGLTLIEVMVALLVGALLVTLAHQVFTNVATTSGALERSAAEATRQANGQRFLQRAIASLEVGVSPGSSFQGSGDRMAFSAWLPGPGQAARLVRVIVIHESPRLLAVLGGDTVVLATDAHSIVFEYLLERGLDQAFRDSWESAVTAPAAVRFQIGHARGHGGIDTVLATVGPRG